MYRPVRTGRLYEKIVEQIEGSILSGQLNPGDKLPSENELTKQFGVSRTAVREAMKALSHKGLIEVSAGRGTYVTDSTSKVMRDSLGLMMKFGLEEGTKYLAEVRGILEPEIAALAAARREQEHILAMQEAYAAMDASMEDIDAFIESDLDFHLAMAEASQNPLILMLIDTMIDLLRESRARFARATGGVARAQAHHRQILKSIMDSDPTAAREAMDVHLERVREVSQASFDLSSGEGS
jgi:GntR family transcriptional repressor for pyruvate dehydrogenase complex